MSDWKDRLVDERRDLDERMTKLHLFIHKNPAFYQLLADDRDLMRQQYLAMRQYGTILDMRITRAFDAS